MGKKIESDNDESNPLPFVPPWKRNRSPSPARRRALSPCPSPTRRSRSPPPALVKKRGDARVTPTCLDRIRRLDPARRALYHALPSDLQEPVHERWNEAAAATQSSSDTDEMPAKIYSYDEVITNTRAELPFTIRRVYEALPMNVRKQIHDGWYEATCCGKDSRVPAQQAVTPIQKQANPASATSTKLLTEMEIVCWRIANQSCKERLQQLIHAKFREYMAKHEYTDTLTIRLPASEYVAIPGVPDDSAPLVCSIINTMIARDPSLGVPGCRQAKADVEMGDSFCVVIDFHLQN